MKLRLLTITLSSLAFCACGGNRGENSTKEAETENVASSVPSQQEITPALSSDKIAMQVWEVLLKDYDPYGMLGEDEVPSAEMIEENRKNIKEKSNTVATFVAEGAEGFIRTIACYQSYADPESWYVLDYFDGQDGSSKSLSVSLFKEGKVVELATAEGMKNLYLSDFTTEGYVLHLDSENDHGSHSDALHFSKELPSDFNFASQGFVEGDESAILYGWAKK